MRKISARQYLGSTVHQICWMGPGPSISARVTLLLPAILMQGDTFQPLPNSRAASAPSPSIAMAPLPFSPVIFSALIERLSALETRERFPRFRPKPLYVYAIVPPFLVS